jgi:hypothetical protein
LYVGDFKEVLMPTQDVLRACCFNKMVSPPLTFHIAVLVGILGSKATM